jgi:hypothetical protein
MMVQFPPHGLGPIHNGAHDGDNGYGDHGQNDQQRQNSLQHRFADLAGEASVALAHVAEALSYRRIAN